MSTVMYEPSNWNICWHILSQLTPGTDFHAGPLPPLLTVAH